MVLALKLATIWDTRLKLELFNLSDVVLLHYIKFIFFAERAEKEEGRQGQTGKRRKRRKRNQRSQRGQAEFNTQEKKGQHWHCTLGH